MQYEVCLEMLEVGFEDGSAVWCGDVRDECNDVRDGSDGIKIDTWWSEDDELSACFGGVERSLQDRTIFSDIAILTNNQTTFGHVLFCYL